MCHRNNRRFVYSVVTAVTLVLVADNARAADVSRPGAGHLSRHDRGEFAVGHSMRVLSVLGTLGEHRPVNVHLWYPARRLDDCDNAGNSGRRYGDDQGCSETPSVYTSRLNGVPLLPQWDPLSWTVGSRTSFEDLPIARGHRPFPVIVFSHGSQNNAIDYVYTLEALARFGFIVAAPDHLNDTQDDVWIDFINTRAQLPLISCFDGLASPCARSDVRKSLTDRVHDINAVIDALPAWFEDRVDISRVGVMGHSRGTVTALAAACRAVNSTICGFPRDLRVKAIMGLAIGTPTITSLVDVQDVTVPALLVAGTLDSTLPVSKDVFFNKLPASTENGLVLIPNANHRHFDSGLCAQTQSSGSIAAASTRAILDLQTLRGLVIAPAGRVAMDFCRFEAFTDPRDDIRPLVLSLTGFDVTPTNVPTTGVDSTDVKEEVVELAVAFFRQALPR
jgi:predicted dienelactone hydrolase